MRARGWQGSVLALAIACTGTPRETAAPPEAPPPAPAPMTSAPRVASAPSPDAGAAAPEVSDESCSLGWEPEEAPDIAAPWAALALHEREPSDALLSLCDKLMKRARAADPESFRCYARPGTASQGVWTFFEEHPNPQRPEQYWRLAYAAPSGTILVAATRTLFSAVDVPAVQGGDLPGLGQLRAITDFDRDGSPEVVVRTGRPIDSSGTPAWSYEVWTVRRGAIVPYAPAAKLKAVWIEDIDSDGVPDLMLDPHGIQLGDGMYWWSAKRDWSLAAHAKADGTFSQDDAAAEKYARTLCPTRPTFPNALSAGSNCFAGVAHCARLWGLDADTIVDAIRSACEAIKDDRLCEMNQAAWATVAGAKLPLALK